MSITEQLAELGPRDLVAVVRSAYGRLCEVGLVSLCDADALAHVADLSAAVAQGEAARLAAVREIDARGTAIEAGASSTAGWLQGFLRERPGAARRLVSVARSLADTYPATAAALAAGAISADHASVICRTLDSLPATVDPADVAAAERTLLLHAADYDPLTLSKLGRHLAYVLDPNGDKALAAHEARLEAGRELFLSQHDDGSWDLRARLDPYTGAQLWAALDSLSAPQPSTAQGPDPRTAPQRRADALAELCERQLTAGQLPSQGGQRPTVIVTTTLEALEGRLGAPAPTLPGGAPISVGQLRRTACDAGVIPVVMGADSVPMDYGRTRYTVPASLRRAVLIRDHWRCIITGCPNTPRHCHHILPWEDDGETEIDNLASLCGYHHRWIHQGREHCIQPVTGGRPLVRIGPAP